MMRAIPDRSLLLMAPGLSMIGGCAGVAFDGWPQPLSSILFALGGACYGVYFSRQPWKRAT